MLKTNTRKVINNVMDARVRLLQKALGEPFVMVDARQKLTRQRDAREIIQERRLHSSTYDVSNLTIHEKNCIFQFYIMYKH
jgi:hypothetical protein